MPLIEVEHLLGRIASALDSEARLIAGVGDELEALRGELVWMKSFLEDVNARTASLTETQRRWVDDVIDMAYSAESIMDDFLYHTHTRRHLPNGPEYFTKLFYATIGFPKNLWKRRQLAKELQKMKRKITDSTERKQRYWVDDSRQERLRSLQEQQRQRLLQNYSESSLFFKDEELVGIEEGRDKLVGWLTDADAELQRTVIAVVGIGGSGKTALAASVYKHQDVKRHFDCCAWITVSQTYDPQDLLKTMIQELNVPTNWSTMRYRELVRTLVEYLGPKRFVIVLDDVWDPNLWTLIRAALPDEGHGSRVLITTRNREIASSFGVQSHVHPVQPLEESEACELFCRNAFPNLPNRTCPHGLQPIAQGLVAKCQGLPLAIVALAGLMSSKNLEYSEWRQVLDGIAWEWSNNPTLDRVKIVLLLSFNGLSYRLKCCFLYCCLFPEDYMIHKERLIRLWMAEGFVETVNGRRPEDIAEMYFVEMVNRNMLQIACWDKAGKPMFCKMHDILREFALDISKRDKFCAICAGRDAIEEVNGARRLSIRTTEKTLGSWDLSSLKLRALFVFTRPVKVLPRGLKLLRVLDLQFVRIVILPDELVDLFNLRYLNLRGSGVEELPKSIGKLRNLQTLDVTNTHMTALPNGITKLHNLRHLSASDDFDNQNLGGFRCANGLAADANICKLKKLQILEGVEANPELTKQARNMTQLTRLAIYKVNGVEQRDLFYSIQSMRLLTHLHVKLSDDDECIQTEALSSAPPCLSVLKLSGRLERMPRWFSSLERLTRLDLLWSRLPEDQDLLQYIHALPNLEMLLLINAYMGRRLCFRTGFRKLKFLDLTELNELIIEKGVMPDVKELWLKGSMELTRLPRGIEFLTNLEALRLEEVSDDLIQGIQKEGSLDRQNLQHIANVSFRDRHFNYRKIVGGKMMT